MAIFPTFFLGNLGQENVFYDIVERKNAFLGYKNKRFKKSKNWHFSKGVNPLFWSKNGHLFKCFFLGNIGRENVFYNILEPKNAFLFCKNKKSKKSKNGNFCKPMVLVQKWPFFQLFFSGNIGQEDVFYDILEQKNAFLNYINKKFKMSKNGNFCKGVNPWFWSSFGPIMAMFPTT